MLLSRFFSRSEARPERRLLDRRQPLVEALEGRQLLTTLLSPDLGNAGSHIGTSVSAIVGHHTGTDLGVGSHIGTNVSEVLIKQ